MRIVMIKIVAGVSRIRYNELVNSYKTNRDTKEGVRDAS